MSHYRMGLLLVAGLVIGLPACHQDASSSTQGSSPVDKVASETVGAISVDPPTLSSCTVGKVVTVNWDVRTKYPNVTDVEIWTGAPPKGALFAAGGPVGKAVTGPWASPGSVFILKNKASGKEIDHVKVDGPSCK